MIQLAIYLQFDALIRRESCLAMLLQKVFKPLLGHL